MKIKISFRINTKIIKNLHQKLKRVIKELYFVNQMWNLFSTVEPKVLKPARSLKQQLLIQEAQNLQQIQQLSKSILNAINSTLKTLSTGVQNNQQKESLTQSQLELECDLMVLQKRLKMQNVRFNECITNRDQQKQNHQQFFKSTMKSYQNKKSQLNKYIKDLQQKVQKLQMLGLKTYSLTPDQDHVLNGFNQKLIDKYLSKLSIINDVQLDIEDIFKSNTKNHLKLNSSCSSKTFSSQKCDKFSLFETLNLCNSLESLQKQLQAILINQQVIGTMLNCRLKKREKQFQKLASQQKALKLGLNKLQLQSEKRDQNKTKQVLRNSNNQKERPQSPKQTKLKSKNSQQESKVNKLDVSFTDSIQQKISQSENDNQNQQNKKQTKQEDQHIPSINFLNACQDLITKTFLEGQQN